MSITKFKTSAPAAGGDGGAGGGANPPASGGGKDNTLKVVLVAALILGTAYVGYKYVYKPWKEKKDAEEARKAQPTEE